MKARYYGYCPAGLGTNLVVTRWYDAVEGHIVLLEFEDDRGIVWHGPEFPPHLEAVRAGMREVHEGKRQLRVTGTRIDAVAVCTDFDVEIIQ